MKTEITNTKRLNILGNGDSLSNREVFTALLKQWRQKLGYFTMNHRFQEYSDALCLLFQFSFFSP